MKKSPNKYKYSAIDPGGFFEKKQPVKPIMNESNKSAFQMKGFPQHAGVSPMRQNKDKSHVPYERLVSGEGGDHTRSTKKKKSILSPENKEKINIFANDVINDLAKAAAVTVVGKLFSGKKKKESVRIIGKDWKIT